MNSPLDVIAIIPAWNREQILLATLEGIARQTQAPRTVVVVDDESPDRTAEVAENWFRAENRAFEWKVIRAPHGGEGATRNVGAREIGSHEFVHFLDSDDVIPPDFYARTVAALSATPELAGASIDQVYVNSSGEILRRRRLGGIEKNPTRWLAYNDGGILSATVIRTSVWRACPSFEEGRISGCDTEFLAHAMADARWAYVAGEPVRYGQLGDNMSQASPEVVRMWATDAEDILPRILPSRWRRSWVLSRRWARTGNLERGWGDRRGAAGAFLRALSHRPLFLLAWRRLIGIALGVPPRSQRKRSTK